MSRKFVCLFDEDQRYFPACQFFDEATCKDHFAAGLNGLNGEAIAHLLDGLIGGELSGLAEDDRLKPLWEKAGYKVEHLTLSATTIVATGRGFGIAHKSGLPRSQSKVLGEVPMQLKALIWDSIGNGTRYLTVKELTARSEVKQPPAKMVESNKPAKSRATKIKAAKVKPGPAEIRAEAA